MNLLIFAFNCSIFRCCPVDITRAMQEIHFPKKKRGEAETSEEENATAVDIVPKIMLLFITVVYILLSKNLTAVIREGLR